jgi:hypothetical protein
MEINTRELIYITIFIALELLQQTPRSTTVVSQELYICKIGCVQSILREPYKLSLLIYSYL